MTAEIHIVLRERATKDVATRSIVHAAGMDIHQLADRLKLLIRIDPSWKSGRVKLTTGASVGTFQVGCLRLDVRPRLSTAVMATLIRYALGRVVEPRNETALPTDSVGIDELLCAMLAEECDRIRQVGLSRLYRKRTEPLSALRGRPEFLASFPLRRTCSAPITCSHHHLTCDNLDNQLLRVGLEHAGLMELSTTTRRRLLGHRRAWSFLASSLWPSRDDFSTARARYTRLSEHYRLAHHLVELIMRRQRPSDLYEQGEVTTKGLVLDMPQLFEKFVERLVTDIVRPYGLRAAKQQPDRGALLDADGAIYRRVRPDLVLYRQDKPVAVIDAKYKDYWRQAEESGQPVRRVGNEDLYQLYFYAQRLQLRYGLPRPPTAYIIAPLPAADERAGYYEVEERYQTIVWRAGSERAGCVRLVNVPMTDILRSMQKTPTWLEGVAQLGSQIATSVSQTM